MGGRLTVEANIEEDLSGLEEKEASFNESKENFEQQYALLAKAVSNDPELKQSLNSVKASYDEYIDNVQTMYTSHRAYMSMRNEIDEQLGVAEDNADDASTYLLDFSDMQAVRNSDDLQEAARVGSELETSLLSLLTVS